MYIYLSLFLPFLNPFRNGEQYEIPLFAFFGVLSEMANNLKYLCSPFLSPVWNSEQSEISLFAISESCLKWRTIRNTSVRYFVVQSEMATNPKYHCSPFRSLVRNGEQSEILMFTVSLATWRTKYHCSPFWSLVRNGEQSEILMLAVSLATWRTLANFGDICTILDHHADFEKQ